MKYKLGQVVRLGDLRIKIMWSQSNICDNCGEVIDGFLAACLYDNTMSRFIPRAVYFYHLEELDPAAVLE